jgi:hypothetical protein
MKKESPRQGKRVEKYKENQRKLRKIGNRFCLEINNAIVELNISGKERLNK